ncbi:hypothetical protein CYMTET_34728 [Cymbomonas tetramitiformis]|uniref:Uncharacterized protein n=1 Tax=Cymbomonas tetramitiformis TaxID=36881 RepID=A0AAE0FAG6_9CHLO|nr:hypothetical protein CYMTET_34728 [Cymbomonas tetramitiformis]
MVQLHAGLDGGAAVHGRPEALKAELAFTEEKGQQRELVAVAREGNGVNKAKLEAQTRNPHEISLAADAERAQMGLAVGLALGIRVLGTPLPGSNIPFGGGAEGAYSTGESTAKEGSMARGGRQCKGTAMGLAWGKDQLASRTSCTV